MEGLLYTGAWFGVDLGSLLLCFPSCVPLSRGTLMLWAWRLQVVRVYGSHRLLPVHMGR